MNPITGEIILKTLPPNQRKFQVHVDAQLKKAEDYYFGDVYALRNILIHENEHFKQYDEVHNNGGKKVFSTMEEHNKYRAKLEVQAIEKQKKDPTYQLSGDLHKLAVEAYLKYKKAESGE